MYPDRGGEEVMVRVEQEKHYMLQEVEEMEVGVEEADAEAEVRLSTSLYTKFLV